MALTDSVRNFLKAPDRYAVLATTNANGLPQQTVMWYSMLDDDTIMMNTKRGRLKDRNMLRDPRVSLCFENGYQYVTVVGSAKLVDDPQRGQRDIHALAVKYDGKESADKASADGFSKEERVTILVTIEKIDSHGF